MSLFVSIVRRFVQRLTRNRPSSFEAERDVVLELLEAAPGGWVKVRHRDGQTGFLKVAQVWGM
jgi:hypothetical protein